MNRMLDLFDELGVKGTMFILGEIAEYFPNLVRRIAAAGHQLGVHGYYHLQVFKQTPAEFRQALDRAKKLIEDVGGREADAHRAVAFSIGRDTMWAFDVLADLGFKYDSSIFPFQGRRYGVPDAPRRPYRHVLPDGRSLWEFPMAVAERAGRRWPALGGGYLRMFPMAYNEWALRSLHAEGIGGVLYLHPYEVETRPKIEMLPGLDFAGRMRFRIFNFHQQLRRGRTIPKLRRLLTRYPFGTMAEAAARLTSSTTPAPLPTS
jgi:polysaccharide deacetylase family protein (PEP-CTERM system associated)